MERSSARYRRFLVAAALAVAGPARAEVTPVTPPADEAAHLATGTDDANRMTVPVALNGSGPFRFVIDTGADHTAVSDRVAAALALPPRGSAMLWSSTSREPIDLAQLGSLDLAGRRRGAFNAAVIHEDTLGASGVLGIDSLADRRVVLDFRSNEMAVAAAPGTPAPTPEQRALDRDPPGTIVVIARRHANQLILTDAYYRGHRIDVVVDTGAEFSIGNLAFLQLVTRNGGALPVGEVMGVTGKTASVKLAVLDELSVGPITLHNPALAFADLTCFERFGLASKPALLLGMNVLRQFDRVAIDFKRREVSFLVPKDVMQSEFGIGVRIAPF